jgi:hypothetical protein
MPTRCSTFGLLTEHGRVRPRGTRQWGGLLGKDLRGIGEPSGEVTRAGEVSYASRHANVSLGHMRE